MKIPYLFLLWTIQVGCPVKELTSVSNPAADGIICIFLPAPMLYHITADLWVKLLNWTYHKRRLLVSWKINYFIVLNDVWDEGEKKPRDPVNSVSPSEPLVRLKFHRLHIFHCNVSFLKIKVYTQQWYNSTFDLVPPRFLTTPQLKPLTQAYWLTYYTDSLHWLNPTSASLNPLPSLSLVLPAQLLARISCGQNQETNLIKNLAK